MTPGSATRPAPRAFISHSWDSDDHRAWVRAFATRLQSDGVRVTLDQWDLQPGDQLPESMERAVRENDYVLIICTPVYAERSNHRRGGVGYEGDIMTAEVLTTRNQRKFVPIYRDGNTWMTAAPTWLQGRYYVDRRGNPYRDDPYQDLIATLHGLHPARPALATPPARPAPPAAPSPPTDPMRILGVVIDEVSMPRNDGTRAAHSTEIPFQLNRQPSATWATLFTEHWNHPSRFTTMHRPGIAHISDDRIYLDGTTMEEVERYHRDTLTLAVQETNDDTAVREREEQARAQRRQQEQQEHERRIRDTARGIKFD